MTKPDKETYCKNCLSILTSYLKFRKEEPLYEGAYRIARFRIGWMAKEENGLIEYLKKLQVLIPDLILHKAYRCHGYHAWEVWASHPTFPENRADCFAIPEVQLQERREDKGNGKYLVVGVEFVNESGRYTHAR